MARLAVVPDLEQELDALFGLPLDEFTPARNALATRLKSAGQAEASAQVRALRKPSLPVWTVNQLARREPEALGQLVEAGRRLRRAQEEAFGGGTGEAVREATAAEREAVRNLTRRAEQILRDEGRPGTRQALDRIASTLRAAAVEPDAAENLARGRLTAEVEAPGFTTVATLAPPPSKRGRPATSDKPNQAAIRAHQQRVRRLEQQLETLERRAADAVERADRAQEAANDARAAADAAAAELDHERTHPPE
jgi:hypothetical protein